MTLHNVDSFLPICAAASAIWSADKKPRMLQTMTKQDSVFTKMYSCTPKARDTFICRISLMSDSRHCNECSSFVCIQNMDVGYPIRFFLMMLSIKCN